MITSLYDDDFNFIEIDFLIFLHHLIGKPSMQPSSQPTREPSPKPTVSPTNTPTEVPTEIPTRYVYEVFALVHITELFDKYTVLIRPFG
jgi:hypothetical protein